MDDLCRRGHAYTEENTVLRVRNGILGGRECRTCKRNRAQGYAERRGRRAAPWPPSDGIVDEVALERAARGDVAVYEALTRKEHKVLVKQLADRRGSGVVDIPFARLRDAVQSELARREKRNGLLGR
jgi:hypothetical protein